MSSCLGGHDRSLEILRPYSCGPVADSHEVFVLGWISLDAVDRPMVLARAHIKHADPVVLLPVSKVHLSDFTGGEDRSLGHELACY